MKLNVGTYNIAHCSDMNLWSKNHDVVSVERMTKVVARLDAEIVGLNEVYSEGGDPEMLNQTEKIAGYLGWDNFVFAEGKHFDWNATIGNAIVAKHKILSAEKFPVIAPVGDERLPGENEWYEDRVILKTVIDVNGTQVTVISTHFGLNGEEHKRMIAKLVPVIDAVKGPLVLMGDFNVQPDNPVLAPLYERLTSVGEATGQKFVPTFDCFHPDITIDYIFCSKHFTPVSFTVLPVIQSDHLPLRATLELTDPAN